MRCCGHQQCCSHASKGSNNTHAAIRAGGHLAPGCNQPGLAAGSLSDFTGDCVSSGFGEGCTHCDKKDNISVPAIRRSAKRSDAYIGQHLRCSTPLFSFGSTKLLFVLITKSSCTPGKNEQEHKKNE